MRTAPRHPAGVPIVATTGNAAGLLGVQEATVAEVVQAGRVRAWGRDSEGRAVFRTREVADALGLALPGAGRPVVHDLASSGQ